MKLKSEANKEVVDILCDICECSCRVEKCYEYATLFAHWGYWSNNKDMTEHECHMCEKCYEKVKEFIEKTLKGQVRIEEYLIGHPKRKKPWLL